MIFLHLVLGVDDGPVVDSATWPVMDRGAAVVVAGREMLVVPGRDDLGILSAMVRVVVQQLGVNARFKVSALGAVLLVLGSCATILPGRIMVVAVLPDRPDAVHHAVVHEENRVRGRLERAHVPAQHVVLGVVRETLEPDAESARRTVIGPVVDRIHELAVRHERALAVLLVCAKVPVVAARQAFAVVVDPVLERRRVRHAADAAAGLVSPAERRAGGAPAVRLAILAPGPAAVLKYGVVVVPSHAGWILGAHFGVLAPVPVRDGDAPELVAEAAEHRLELDEEFAVPGKERAGRVGLGLVGAPGVDHDKRVVEVVARVAASDFAPRRGVLGRLRGLPVEGCCSSGVRGRGSLCESAYRRPTRRVCPKRRRRPRR